MHATLFATSVRGTARRLFLSEDFPLLIYHTMVFVVHIVLQHIDLLVDSLLGFLLGLFDVTVLNHLGEVFLDGLEAFL